MGEQKERFSKFKAFQGNKCKNKKCKMFKKYEVGFDKALLYFVEK
jgi:hypothetical protein